ncbi:adenylate/guanylate cyclase domain-containing protein [Amycolatopsis jiangsuensis]|uniref:Adenylate cyclase n=1 Tax=Amycolatopsis jiangsuensis TaxID=1181879 RepID=A0A840ISN8_9PSEU|nr:adenylate/guanylate cyclase domain-containing protein [Amycolatopsis jiangsuensis]MBB4685631.1 adenylate cyclase [Amycolatopsis jiangsuensis]
MPESSRDLQQRLEGALLGGPRRYTRLDVAKLAGVPEERSRRLWRALGFATVEDDEVVFTDADVEAMRTADQLVQSGLVEPGLEVAVTRALGQHLSRLAEWQVRMLWELITENPDLAGNEPQVTRLVEGLLPELERVQSYVWRRHLAAYAGRAFANAEEDLESRTQVVGFVDMVGYTRLTRQVDEEELSRVLDSFETLAAEVIADHHGRVVKMIGDEVLFVTDSPADGGEIALTLAERTGTGELPAVRAGLASGRVLSRFGDVYGSVVNVAARLTSLARPGTVLVDRALAGELEPLARFELRSRRPVAVRGYHRLRPSALRRGRERPTGRFASSQERAAEMLGLDETTRDNPEPPETGEDLTIGSRGRRRRRNP